MEKYHTLTNSASYIKYSYAPSTTPIITKHWMKKNGIKEGTLKTPLPILPLYCS